MAHHSLLRSLALVPVALFGASLGAVAQQPGVIRVGAAVTAAAGSVTRADSASAAPRHDTQRVRIAGIGRVDVQTGPGAEVRVGQWDGGTVGRSPDPAVPPSLVRVTIAYVGN